MSQSLLAIAAEVAVGAVVLPLATGVMVARLPIRRAGGHGRGGPPPPPAPLAPGPCGDDAPALDWDGWAADLAGAESTDSVRQESR